jgi:hypothetical protein
VAAHPPLPVPARPGPRPHPTRHEATHPAGAARLEQLIRRGQRTGDFDPALRPTGCPPRSPDSATPPQTRSPRDVSPPTRPTPCSPRVRCGCAPQPAAVPSSAHPTGGPPDPPLRPDDERRVGPRGPSRRSSVQWR